MTYDEFRRHLDELRSVILDGIAYFSAWRGLMVDEDSVRALNRYRGLFMPARNALIWMALMQFAKVFDRDRRTVSLRNLLTAAKMNRENLTPFAAAEELEQLALVVDSNAGLLKRLKRLRDQRMAHHDANASGDRSMPYGEVARLVEQVKSMYNTLRRGHDRSTTMFESLSDDSARHTSEVVRIMREELDRANRRIARAETQSRT